MKTKNLAKILVLALSLVLLMTAVIGITASAEGEDDRGNIYSTSIVHNDKISIAIAVKATAEEIANNTVTVKYQWADEAEPKTATYFGTHENQEGYVWVVTEGVAAYDLAREATITSYLNEGLVESGKYSVATFLYNKLYIDGVTGAAQECYETLLEYGATSQVYLDKNVDAPVNALNYAYTNNADVKINGSSSAFGSNVTLAYIGDQILEGWVVDGVTYPASQTTFEINGTCSVDVICTEKIKVNITIGEFANGTVTTDKDSYNVGDTITLTITPASGYFQKLYINDEPLMLEWKTKTYSFVAEKDTYVIDGSFEPSLEVYAGDWGRWDNANQAHGVLAAYYPNNNDAWWFKIKGDYNSFAINAKNYRDIANSYEGGPDGGWRIALYMQLDNGKYYAFGMWINTDKVYAYNHFGGNIDGVASTTGWSGAWCLLSDKNAEATAALNGNGAEFKLERIDGNHIQITFGGTVLETYEIPGVTADNKVVSVGLLHYGNKGAHVDIPFTLTVPSVEEEPSVPNDDVALTIGEFANGTVTADKESYKIGDTVTLTLAPNAGYFQQLYINGEPLTLDWKSKVYSFVAEENKYEITGNFVKEYSMNVYDWGRWDNYNQAHGLITTYYPNNDDSWWMNFNGEYESIAVTVKNHMPQESSPSFSHVLRMTLGGKFYAFRIFAENGIYCYGRYGATEGKATTGMAGDWSHWKDLSSLAGDINGDGVVFKITRTGADELTITINGEVVDTYTIAGATADTKVESVGMIHYGNKGQKVQIPFELN